MNSTLSTVISIFLLLLVGYGAKKFGILSQKDSSVVASIVVNLSMPAFIFTSLHGRPLNSDMAKAPLILFLAEMLVMGCAYLVARAIKLDRPTTGALMLVAAFGNTGFLGYPIVSAAFTGKFAMPAAVMVDQFGMQLPIGTIGIAVAACFAGSGFRWNSLLAFLKTPMFPTTLLALLLRNAYVPPLILSSLSYLGAATIPLAMISVGLGMSTGSIKKYPAPLVVAMILKLAVQPVLAVLGMRLAGIHGTVADIGIVLAATPSAVLCAVFTAQYGANPAFAATAVAASTLASAFWIPAVLVMLR
ncbi:MAG: AEC family transporter [Armatimonadota bacterium]